jgi:hypothetical protein
VVTLKATGLRDHMTSRGREMRKGAVTTRAEQEINKDSPADPLGYAAVAKSMTEYV